MNGFVDWKLLLAVETFAQRLAFDVRHHVVEKAVGGAGVEQRKDVRMVEPRGELDLAKKPVGAERCGEVGVEDLEGDDAIVLAVLGEVDGRHPAAAELAIDGVGAGERVAQALNWKLQIGEGGAGGRGKKRGGDHWGGI